MSTTYRGGRRFAQAPKPEQTVAEQILTNRERNYENWNTAVTPWAYAKPKGKQSAPRKQYNQKGQEDMRRREGDKTMKSLRSTVDDKYAISAEDTAKILAQLEANATIKTYTTFITTRGIGFS